MSIFSADIAATLWGNSKLEVQFVKKISYPPQGSKQIGYNNRYLEKVTMHFCGKLSAGIESPNLKFITKNIYAP